MDFRKKISQIQFRLGIHKNFIDIAIGNITLITILAF